MQTLLKRIFLYFKIQNSQACISEYFIMIVFKLQQIYKNAVEKHVFQNIRKALV